MSQKYICVHAETSKGLVPVGVVVNAVPDYDRSQMLSDFRQKCQTRGFMHGCDPFLYVHGSQTFPISKVDEATIGVQDYCEQCGGKVVIRRGVVGQPAESGGRNEQIAERDATVVSTSVDRSGPIVTASYVLGCWGSKYPKNPANREEVVSYTVTPLPDYSFKEDMTFCVFARTLQDGRRCVLSVESPYHEKSVLCIGTCQNSREVEAYTMASGTTKSGSHFTIQKDEWTHIALIWNASIHAVLLLVDGQQVKQAYLEQRDKVEFMQSLKELRLVLGRLKLGSGIAAGWDGEITNARVWQRALDEREITAEADRKPKPLTSASLSSGGWRRC